MYLEHFGLAQYPFSLNPNTRFFFKLPGHELAFNRIVGAVESGEPLIKIVGEVGTGKTMLCRKTLNALSQYPERYRTAFIPHPILSESDALTALADELREELDCPDSYYELLKKLSAIIVATSSSGLRSVLFIDEAQAMPEETLQALALLSQLNEVARPLQIILFGQPELDENLDHPALRQVARQIRVSYRLPALDQGETEAYIDYRLNKAGFNGRLFDSTALSYLHQHSGGIPRRVNILCHKALLAGFGKGSHVIGSAEVEAAVKDSDDQRNPESGP